MKKVIRLTERDLTRIVKRVIMEQASNEGATIKELDTSLSIPYVILSNGNKYVYTEGNYTNQQKSDMEADNGAIGSMTYNPMCKKKKYKLKEIPDLCSISTSDGYFCDKNGCKKRENTGNTGVTITRY